MKSVKITVIGLGFVGLTTAVGFAKKGFTTFGYEIDQVKAKLLQKGQIPFFEEGLQEGLQDVIDKKFFITNSLEDALRDSDVVFYCIGTPMNKEGFADLSFLITSLKETASLIKICKPKPTLIIKSTIPPSTSQEVFIPLLKTLGLKVNMGDNSDCFLANNPEFLREGFAYQDFLNPDRIVVGSSQELEIIKKIYAPFNAPIIFTNLNSAEFIKYLSNTTLAMQISFANEMSMIAEKIGNIDIQLSFQVLHQDKRFHGSPANITSYIYPGLGFGGYCLPKDTLALHKKSQEKGFDTKILKGIIETNERILTFYLEKISQEVSKDAKIGILGLSFKPGSDDVRDSKSKSLIDGLLERGFKNIIAYDPIANDVFKQIYALPICYTKTSKELVDACDVCIIATAWEEFTQCNFTDKKVYNLRFLKL